MIFLKLILIFKVSPMEGLALEMGDGETPAFLAEPRGLTQQVGSHQAGVCALAGGLSALTQL